MPSHAPIGGGTAGGSGAPGTPIAPTAWVISPAAGVGPNPTTAVRREAGPPIAPLVSLGVTFDPRKQYMMGMLGIAAGGLPALGVVTLGGVITGSKHDVTGTPDPSPSPPGFTVIDANNPAASITTDSLGCAFIDIGTITRLVAPFGPDASLDTAGGSILTFINIPSPVVPNFGYGYGAGDSGVTAVYYVVIERQVIA